MYTPVNTNINEPIEPWHLWLIKQSHNIMKLLSSHLAILEIAQHMVLSSISTNLFKKILLTNMNQI